MAPTSSAWQTPAPLEGGKSRKRTIFKVEKASVLSDDKTSWTVSGVNLSLESRVAAIGDGGKIVLALLQRDLQQSSGTVSHHPSLVVAHLGPHLAGRSAGIEEHMSAIAVALKQKPQIVILDEELTCGGAGWARVFREVLQSAELAAFKGAVVVACEEVTFSVRRVCSEAWVDVGSNVIQQTSISQRLQIIEDALAGVSSELGVATNRKKRGRNQANAEIDCLIEEAAALSEFCFEEDLVAWAHQEGWTVALLIEVHQDGPKSLRGFLCYKVVSGPNKNALHIERLAVDRRWRGRGFAKILMQWILGEAARQPQSDCSIIACDSVQKAIPFYELFGFSVCDDQPQDQDEEDALTAMERENVSLVCEAA